MWKPWTKQIASIMIGISVIRGLLLYPECLSCHWVLFELQLVLCRYIYICIIYIYILYIYIYIILYYIYYIILYIYILTSFNPFPFGFYLKESYKTDPIRAFPAFVIKFRLNISKNGCSVEKDDAADV